MKCTSDRERVFQYLALFFLLIKTVFWKQAEFWEHYYFFSLTLSFSLTLIRTRYPLSWLITPWRFKNGTTYIYSICIYVRTYVYSYKYSHRPTFRSTTQHNHCRIIIIFLCPIGSHYNYGIKLNNIIVIIYIIYIYNILKLTRYILLTRHT